MLENLDKCVDSRGVDFVRNALDEIGVILGGNTAEDGAMILNRIFERLELEIPQATDEEYDELVRSVNPDRMKNHPVALDEKSLRDLYRLILR